MTTRHHQSQVNFPRALRLLQHGSFSEVHGLLNWGSNYTFLASIADDEMESLAIYKPRRGERPLWDFPDGTLCQREVAAFVISEAFNWHLVPPTSLRDGPSGPGMVQLFIEHDPEQHYFTLGPRYKRQLQRIALFDYIINNADRKGGHCLVDKQGHVWAIDHGVSFHTQLKLRTVIWDFAGERISEESLAEIRAFAECLAGDELRTTLFDLLDDPEVKALAKRTRTLLESGVYPQPGSDISYPWPPI
jgi:uncharacterized repeat protein (TIGR03843 family)